MRINQVMVQISVLFVLSGSIWGQSALFVMISPSTAHNGMGEAGVASPSAEPAALFYNPAAGALNFNRGVFGSYAHMKTQWLPSLVSDMWYSHSATIFQVLPFQESTGGGLHLKTLVLGKSVTKLDAGEQMHLDSLGTYLGTFNVEFAAENTSLGLGLEYTILGLPIDIGLGVTYKVIKQDLLGQYDLNGSAKNRAYDWGAISRTNFNLTLERFGLSGQLLMSPALGYSVVNIGEMVVFNNAEQADPLPRTARLGVSLSLDYDNGNIIHPFRLHIARSAQNYLGRWNGEEWNFDSGLGDIDFFQHVIGQNPESDIIVNKGIELSFFDAFKYREGRYQDEGGKVVLGTFGYEISLVGVMQLVGVLDLIENSKSTAGRYFDISLLYAGYKPDGGYTHPLSGTYFQSVRLEIMNMEDLFKKL